MGRALDRVLAVADAPQLAADTSAISWATAEVGWCERCTCVGRTLPSTTHQILEAMDDQVEMPMESAGVSPIRHVPWPCDAVPVAGRASAVDRDARALGGSLSVESEPGRGCSWIVTGDLIALSFRSECWTTSKQR